jgi:hypothetical protein
MVHSLMVPYGGATYLQPLTVYYFQFLTRSKRFEHVVPITSDFRATKSEV